MVALTGGKEFKEMVGWMIFVLYNALGFAQTARCANCVTISGHSVVVSISNPLVLAAKAGAASWLGM